MWNGAFSPTVQKHELGTGDIANHIRIGQPVIDEEAETATIVVSFVRSPDERYVFEIDLFRFPKDSNDEPEINTHTVGEAIKAIWKENGGNLGAPVSPNSPGFWG